MPKRINEPYFRTTDGCTCVYKPDHYSMHKCDGCGCQFKVRMGEYIYRLEVKVPYATKYLKFCSYNCRSKYKKTKLNA